ncbi:MAG: ligase-associated DNA damage response endonuclease PdeM [Burkholderiales bacterium]|nr:MAG: ligase-associated DNA damage response endonuclease PdeM [Burkholderiales bacterium]
MRRPRKPQARSDAPARAARQPVPVGANGVELVLLGERAAWLPGAATLLVADVHLGKAASFGALGVPVPDTTAATLARLDALVRGHAPRRLVVLGDLLHGLPAHRSGAVRRLSQWRRRHPRLDIVLVRGNHDDRAGDPPPECAIEVVDEPLALDDRSELLLCHTPRPEAGGYVIAGHLHPAFRLATRADSIRLPCFWLRPAYGVLPAFGDFTGGWPIRPAPGDRVFIADGERVHRVPTATAS